MNELIEINKFGSITSLDPVEITLKEITDLLQVRHDKAIIKVEVLSKEPSFGTMSKMDTQYKSGKNTTQTIQTYGLTKRQAIAVGAKLNNALLMKLIDRLDEIQKQKTPLELAREQVRLYEALELKTKEVLHLEVVLDEANDFSSIKKQEVIHNTKFPWKPLKDYHLNNGIKLTKVFDQNYTDGVNSYSRDAWLEVYDVNL